MASTITFAAALVLLMAIAPATAITQAPNCFDYPHLRRIEVSSPIQLDNAIKKAKAGDLIHLAPGTYNTIIRGGNFRHVWVNNKQGSSKYPIVICGSRDAILKTNSVTDAVVFGVEKSSNIILAGFTVTTGLKGVQVWRSQYVTLDGLYLSNFAGEAIHVQYSSHYNTIKRCTIKNTGRTKPGNGEGIYLGSDDQRGQDKCVGNQALFNEIGPGVTAEGIDVKQNSRDGLIQGNILDGRNLCNCNSAVSVMSVKGNGYRIIDNVGKNSKQDYFKVAQTQAGEGKDNYFEGNRCVTPVRGGYECVKVPTTRALPNKVACGQKTNTRCLG